jgi:hypothetical protein
MRIELKDIDPELVDEIADRVFQKLKPLLSKKQGEEEDVIFDVKELADYLGGTPKRTHFKGIPFYKLRNKQLRFKKKDIDKWLEGVKSPAIEQFSWKYCVMYPIPDRLITKQQTSRD